MQSNKRTLAGPLAEGRTNKREAAVLQFAKQVSVCTYDFSVDGGALGDISFGQSLPAGAVVTDIYADAVTAVTGATAVTIKAGSTSLSTAANWTSLPVSPLVSKLTLAGSAAAIRMTAAGELKITIATAAATAGKVNIYVEWAIKPGTLA